MPIVSIGFSSFIQLKAKIKLLITVIVCSNILRGQMPVKLLSSNQS